MILNIFQPKSPLQQTKHFKANHGNSKNNGNGSISIGTVAPLGWYSKLWSTIPV